MRDAQKNIARIRRLKEKFNRTMEVCAPKLDETLYEILIRTVGQLLETTSGNVDAQALDYFDMLLQEIVEVNGEGEDDQSESIEALLWQYNFNSRQYFLYYILKGLATKRSRKKPYWASLNSWPMNTRK